MPSFETPGTGTAPHPDDAALGAASAPDDVERALLAQLHFTAGAWQAGLDACSGGAARGLSLIEARGRFGLGQRDLALNLLERLLAERPGDALVLYHKAQFLAQSGRRQEAVLVLAGLVASLPDFPGALLTLASLVFPGPPYRDVLARLHGALRPRSYLEIGVEHGTSLALAVHSRQVVGVDPVSRPPTRALPAAARLFQMTSDDFFAQHERADVFGDTPVDLAFLDGMHLFEYTLRDFMNVERWCGPGSTIVLHDCLPPHPVAAARERRSSFWVGDAWKALECLLERRPDLHVTVVPCYPSGLVVIQNVDPASTLLRGALEALSLRYVNLGYPYEPGVFPSHYPLVANAEPQFGRLLAAMQTSASARGA
jgi:hypothetical protein